MKRYFDFDINDYKDKNAIFIRTQCAASMQWERNGNMSRRQ